MVSPPMPPRYLRPREVAHQLGLSRAMVSRLIASRALPSVKIGRAVRIPAEGLEQFLKERERAN